MITIECPKCDWKHQVPDEKTGKKALYNHVYRVHTIGAKTLDRRRKKAVKEKSLRGKYPRALRKPAEVAAPTSTVEPCLLPSCPACGSRFYIAKGS